MQHIVSDVHGCYHTLVKLIDRIRAADDKAQFIFVGDYTDRGLLSRNVVDYIIKMQTEGAICLRGNHDDVIDHLLNGHSMSMEKKWDGEIPPVDEVLQWWMHNGFLSTLDSYGVQVGLSLEDIGEQFKDKVPQSHKDFFRQLPMWWENDTHFAGHGYFDPCRELPTDVKFIGHNEETLWERFNLNHVPVWDKIGVFGHTPVAYYQGAITPVKYGNLRLIDTCAFGDEYLCGYCCQADDHILQATDRRDIECSDT